MRSKLPDFAESYVRRHRLARQENAPYQRLRQIEGLLRNVIQSELTIVTPKWWEQRVPGDVRETAERRKRKEEARPWPWSEDHEFAVTHYLDFNDYAKILWRGDNWRDAFSRIFRDPSWLQVNLKELDPIRKAIAHSRGITSIRVRTLELLADKLAALIDTAGQSKVRRASWCRPVVR